jgi:outer membrane protein assembly factor BamD (BamD/ComL family)
MLRAGAAALLLALELGTAPLQCTKEPDPALRREETPDEALHQLSEDFRARGDDAAARHTLEVLVAKYPSSRFAPAARAELGLADAGGD